MLNYLPFYLGDSYYTSLHTYVLMYSYTVYKTYGVSTFFNPTLRRVPYTDTTMECNRLQHSFVLISSRSFNRVVTDSGVGHGAFEG